jgi:hypothetical protein
MSLIGFKRSQDWLSHGQKTLHKWSHNWLGLKSSNVNGLLKETLTRQTPFKLNLMVKNVNDFFIIFLKRKLY